MAAPRGRSARSSGTRCRARCCSASTTPTATTTAPATTRIRPSGDFKPGAYDLQRFEVYDAGDQIVFRVRTRDLTPTFGNPFGAQLIDVYVHIPGASPTSTAAAFPQRNYTTTPWAKRIEIQGFGQQYVDAAGATLGQVTSKANDISRFITFSVSKASLGTPGPGWGFTVTLTGQDGFSPDQARGFQTDPGALPVRRLRNREQRSALHRQPEHRPEGDGHAHAPRRSSTTRSTPRSCLTPVTIP